MATDSLEVDTGSATVRYLVLDCNDSEATTTASTSSSSSGYRRDRLAHLLMTSLVLGAIILATIVGNVFVIAAIVLERNLRNVANYLIASLAVTDLLVAALVMPLAAVNEVSSRWFLGREACDAFVSFDVLCCTSSILHLVAISIDRYWAVTRVEYIHNRSSRRILAMVAASWGVSALISLPPLFGGRNPNSDPDITGICLISQDWAYTVFSTLGAFYLPMVVMSVIYARVYRTARHRIRKTTFRRPLQGDASVDRGNARLLGPCDVDQSTPQTLLQGGTPFYRQVTQSTTDTQPELTPPVEVQLPPAKVEATAAGNVEDWIGLSSVLRPRQLSVGYLGDGGNVEEELKNDVDDVDDAERESGEKFSTTAAVGNACTIILAAASTAPPAADIVNIDEDLNTDTPEPHQSPMSIMSPFFARFLDGNWLAASVARRPAVLRRRRRRRWTQRGEAIGGHVANQHGGRPTPRQREARTQTRTKSGENAGHRHRNVSRLLASFLHRCAPSTVLHRNLLLFISPRQRHQLARIFQQPSESDHIHGVQSRLSLGFSQDPVRQVSRSLGPVSHARSAAFAVRAAGVSDRRRES